MFEQHMPCVQNNDKGAAGKPFSWVVLLMESLGVSWSEMASKDYKISIWAYI